MQDVLETGIEDLMRAGVDTSRLDARVLAAEILNCEPNQVLMHSSRVLIEPEYEAFIDLIARRCTGEPVSRIVGRREFWSLPFFLSPDTLDPRPDSETVVEAALSLLADARHKPISILDLGTGTGCLLLSLLKECPSATGVGGDISEVAIQTAQRNAKALGVDARVNFFVGDWSESLTGYFDLIISNPPYIREDEMAGLAPEVRNFDPMRALVGGRDGLDAYRRLIPDCCRLLHPRGALIVELGQGQHEDIESIMSAANLSRIERHHDLGGIIRCLSAQAV